MCSADARLRVLAVDDEPSTRAALVHALRDYDCESAASGNEAFEKHRQHPFDVIVSDWNMAEGDGVELCRKIRSDHKRYVYFILITADDPSRMFAGLKAGADDFIGKPFDIAHLEARLLTAKRIIALQNKLLERTRAARRDSRRMFVVSREDALTGVRNRRALEDDLPRYADDAVRYKRKYSCAMFDVDHFKLYNDTFGHIAGDEVLHRVATTLSAELRKSDIVYRYGGEEFLAILPEQSELTATTAVERAIKAVRDLSLPHANGASHRVITASAGIAELRGDIHEWLARADAALYRAKAAGRNRAVTG